MSGRRLAWVLMLLLTLALALEVRSAAHLWRASLVLGQVKAVTLEANRRGRLSPRLLEHNVDLLRRVEAASPVEVGLPIARGGQYLLLGRPKAAVRTLEKALRIEPRGEVYAHLGRAYLALGDRQAADEAFGTAFVLDPSQRRGQKRRGRPAESKRREGVQ